MTEREFNEDEEKRNDLVCSKRSSMIGFLIFAAVIGAIFLGLLI